MVQLEFKLHPEHTLDSLCQILKDNQILYGDPILMKKAQTYLVSIEEKDEQVVRNATRQVADIVGTFSDPEIAPFASFASF